MAKKCHGTRRKCIRTSTKVALLVVGIAMVMTMGFLGATHEVGSQVAAASPSTSTPIWLCRPGLRDNPCTSNLTTTIVRANGTTYIQPASPARHPPIDCFYVYPTVSTQPTANANLHIDPQEKAVAIAQASRFSQVSTSMHRCTPN